VIKDYDPHWHDIPPYVGEVIVCVEGTHTQKGFAALCAERLVSHPLRAIEKLWYLRCLEKLASNDSYGSSSSLLRSKPMPSHCF
jgi:hypothetical protein